MLGVRQTQWARVRWMLGGLPGRQCADWVESGRAAGVAAALTVPPGPERAGNGLMRCRAHNAGDVHQARMQPDE